MNDMLTIDPKEIATKDLHQFILGAVSPRPIAFASTIDENGIANLAPYSFFNAFSSNPPIVVFSSNRRVANNTTKDTLHNIMLNKEVVINVVNYDIVRRMAITSVEYDADIDEFEKAGLTKMPSDIVKPFRVAESPAHMECQVQEVIALGVNGGAGHLIVARVVKMHIARSVMDERQRIDPQKIDLVGRLGRSWYARIKGDCIFELHQPVNVSPVGYDGLPESIRHSHILSGREIGILASHPLAETEAFHEMVKAKYPALSTEEKLHQQIADLIKNNQELEALALAMTTAKLP